MKRSLVKLVSLSYLFAATHLMTISCASSDEGAGDEIASEDGNESADADNADNENVEGNNANNEEGGNNLGANEGNAVANNEFGNGAEGSGNALAGAEGTSAGGDENLQQIIEEMNSANPSAPAPEQGFDNLAQNAGAAPAAEAPVAQAAASTGAPAAPGLPELGSKMAYIVQKGDTLAKIAAHIYGEANKWTEIADFTGIANPKLIYPGDVVYYQLTEKTATFATVYEGISRSEVEVAQGDTLATIASKVFGNSSLWKMIWRQNDKIDNPDHLIPGTKVYYIDQARLAAFHKEVSSKVASSKAEKIQVKANKVVKSEVPKSKSQAQKSSVKSIDVANDQVVDQFSHISSQNLVARLI